MVAKRNAFPSGCLRLAVLGPPKKGVSGIGKANLPFRGTLNLTFLRVPPTLLAGETALLSREGSTPSKPTSPAKVKADAHIQMRPNERHRDEEQVKKDSAGEVKRIALFVLTEIHKGVTSGCPKAEARTSPLSPGEMLASGLGCPCATA